MKIAPFAVAAFIATPAIADKAEYEACVRLLSEAQNDVTFEQIESVAAALVAAEKTGNPEFEALGHSAAEAADKADAAWEEYTKELRAFCAGKL